ncbi:universal stress protein [Mucilaginibacter paludis]|uniref:UspA domain-containing protein n=1 Tax=Mucilaginibacter paludis DSM 18603 TaxID=714943 RepID=H1Y5E5_9SPHI|nr:universal stress protein [Mucilaginibacter paludis]EHQ28956.1 UspA domain-containing protein [Mucilaginibacter paludis DSM 18603]
MKQILVATDFSPSAANAMEYAMGLAVLLKLEVCAIHAIHPTEGINNSTYNAIFIEDYYRNKREALNAWAAVYTDKKVYKDVNVTTLCDVGFLKTVITNYIDSHPVELLAMGITGATGLSGIVGSNASMMVTKVKIPTLIVPLESKFPDTPVITLATDYETKLSADDVNALNEMIKAFRCEQMQVLYVEEKSDAKHIQTGEARLKELLTNTNLVFNYLKDSSPISGITDFVENNETDILCLVKHHHNIIYRLFTRSTVNQIMNRSVKAILVLHE